MIASSGVLPLAGVSEDMPLLPLEEVPPLSDAPLVPTPLPELSGTVSSPVDLPVVDEGSLVEGDVLLCANRPPLAPNNETSNVIDNFFILPPDHGGLP
ncbi:MAG TPA: hypothetical protein VM571_12925 [Noviherbaspirillum sp.]|nr:hypothetical protein [Noviherbaspirillum sp.]